MSPHHPDNAARTTGLWTAVILCTITDKERCLLCQKMQFWNREVLNLCTLNFAIAALTIVKHAEAFKINKSIMHWNENIYTVLMSYFTHMKAGILKDEIIQPLSDFISWY